MCRKVICRTCQKPSWAGCGAHVEQVLAGVPKGERCRCSAADRAAARTGTSWWSRLLGR